LSSDPSLRAEGLDPEKMPVHVAVIMDGNGRWAKKRLLNRVRGHERGADVVREIVTVSREIGLAYLTLYAFSTENWARPKAEVGALMGLLKRFLREERPTMMENRIRFNTIGETHRLPQDVQDAIQEVREATAEHDAMVLTLALSYGGRAEITAGMRRLAAEIAAGRLGPESVTEDRIAASLFTHNMPDPDLMIRTSGEQRISNFLLWQLAYAELMFTETLWPDFGRDEFISMIRDYQGRQRRFGKVD